MEFEAAIENGVEYGESTVTIMSLRRVLIQIHLAAIGNEWCLKAPKVSREPSDHGCAIEVWM